MAKIMVVGSGIVGKATGKGLIKRGHKVIFIDKNVDIINEIRQQGFEARLAYELEDITADFIMFCVSTPSNSDGSVNLNNMGIAIVNYGKWLRCRINSSWPLVVIRSTVPPGTTRKILLPLLEAYSGLTAGKDFGLCMQPEFLRAISCEEDSLHPWATVIGELDKKSGDALVYLYDDFGSEIFRMDLEAAEFLKYVHNCFNATKISFANEVWLLGKELGIDTNSIISIAAKTAEGFWNPNYGTIGGQPYGGSCLPKDTKGLLTFCQKANVDMPLLEAVISVNSKMEELAEQGLIPHPTIAGPRWQPSPVISKKNLKKDIIWEPLTSEDISYSSSR